MFTTSARVAAKGECSPAVPWCTVSAIARHPTAVTARAGLRVLPDHAIDQHPPIDVLIVPGGVVTHEMRQREAIDWIRRTAHTSQVTASVCTGAFLLAQAGVLVDQTVTTHWEDVDDLQAQFPRLNVVEGPRWVQQGSVWTSAGISAGIDLSLKLVAHLASPELAQATARQMDVAWLSEA